MNFISAAWCGFRARLQKKLLFALIIINLLTANAFAQTNLTRHQFSRFPVLTRAGFFENEILKAANAHSVDPNVLWAIAYNETRFRPYLTSPRNAQGLMQFIKSTAARYDLTNPYEPVSSIRAAARYVKYLSDLFGGRIDSILAAYNSGEGTVTAYLTGKSLRNGQKITNPKGVKTIGGVPPYAETIAYVGRGLKIYRWLISHGTFPVNVVRANFPTVISASVARVSLVDYELGKVPDFKAPVFVPQTFAKIPAVNKIGKKPFNQNSEQNLQTKNLAEIYYDSRSGNRYAIVNGNQTKLTENGVVIITNNSRPATTNKARSTFFAAPSK
jgi:Transglycosylase SLT domain